MKSNNLVTKTACFRGQLRERGERGREGERKGERERNPTHDICVCLLLG